MSEVTPIFLTLQGSWRRIMFRKDTRGSYGSLENSIRRNWLWQSRFYRFRQSWQIQQICWQKMLIFLGQPRRRWLHWKLRHYRRWNCYPGRVELFLGEIVCLGRKSLQQIFHWIRKRLQWSRHGLQDVRRARGRGRLWPVIFIIVWLTWIEIACSIWI